MGVYSRDRRWASACLELKGNDELGRSDSFVYTAQSHRMGERKPKEIDKMRIYSIALLVLLLTNCSHATPVATKICLAWERNEAVSDEIERRMFAFVQNNKKLTIESNEIYTHIKWTPTNIVMFSSSGGTFQLKHMSVFQIFETKNEFDEKALQLLLPEVAAVVETDVKPCDQLPGFYPPTLFR